MQAKQYPKVKQTHRTTRRVTKSLWRAKSGSPKGLAQKSQVNFGKSAMGRPFGEMLTAFGEQD
ncbi:hypothetical protein H5410_005089 [Solanum commersonii]|uniref:Uncharacterized protein n=1 Tax=Solanum commersonii TaxID=4109 RepID=A0A9J6A749_SOLCO|nr:hypothetical protein H5410_005089 [Solanum commersonii]